MAEKAWPGQGTLSPQELIAHYHQKTDVLRRAAHWYETWRKTTAMVDPPVSWDALDIRMKVAFCAVAEAAREDGLDSDDT